MKILYFTIVKNTITVAVDRPVPGNEEVKASDGV